MNSKKEWDTFNRQLKNKKLFPIRLTEHVQRDKADVFNQWLECGKDLQEHLANQ